MTAPRCRLCREPLDRAAILNACATCTTCALTALRAARKGTRAVAVALRDAGQQAATDAHPDDRALVDAAIRTLAASGREFSANEATTDGDDRD